MNKKILKVSEVTREIVDGSTGEVLQVTRGKQFVTKVQPDEFFMVFIENMAPFFGLKNISDMKLLSAMCKVAEFNTGVVSLTQKTREYLSTISGISLTNISKNLKRLVKLDLIKGEKGEYKINPKIFWKGSTTTRHEVLQNEGFTWSITIVEQTPTD